MKPMTSQEYTLSKLEMCLRHASDSCDECEGKPAGEYYSCCQTNGGDLVNAVGQALADLKAEIKAAQKK